MYYNQIGYIKKHGDDFENAIVYYQKAIDIEEASSPDDPLLAVFYSNIGGVYSSTRECSRALSFYEKALKMETVSCIASFISCWLLSTSTWLDMRILVRFD